MGMEGHEAVVDTRALHETTATKPPKARSAIVMGSNKTPAGEPYVPGSSIKGKMRFLLEWAFGALQDSGKPWGMETKKSLLSLDDPVLRIFGTPSKREEWDGGPTRLLVRDAMLAPEWSKQTIDRGLLLTEAKTEVTIDRIAGKALHGVGARQTERVPQGARFQFEAAFRLYDVEGDGGRRDRECLAWTIQGLDLLEQDALGGSGSRGYGRIRFEDLTLYVADRQPQRLDNIFRNHSFSRQQPPGPILKAIEDVVAAA